MYPVSEAYVRRIMSGSVSNGWSGTIVAKSGRVFNFTVDDLCQGQTAITRSICTGENIEIGTACSTELALALYLDVDRYLLYNATITLNYELFFDDNSSEIVPCGVFTITEPPTRNLGIVTIHAYDNMSKFDVPFGMLTSGTPYDVLLLACTNCGVTLGMTREEVEALPNGKSEVSVYKDAIIDTYRDLVAYTAAVLCGVAVINPAGELQIKQYDIYSVRTIPADWRYSYEPQDYETAYSMLSALNMSSNEVETVMASGRTDGLLYEMGDNPLIPSESEAVRKQALQNIVDKLSIFSYTPFVAKVPCDPALEVGDVIDFTDGQAVAGKVSVITSIEMTVNGGMTLKCVGGNPHAANTKTQMDKLMSGMLTGNAGSEVVTYGYTNAKALSVGVRRKTPIFQLAFATASKTPKIDIWTEILLDTRYIDGSGIIDPKDPMTVTVTYALNGIELAYEPVETYLVQGKHILSLHYFIPQVEPNTRYTWTVSLTMYNGAATIEPECVHALLSGQGLVAEDGMTGLGIIDLFDDVYVVSFRNSLNIVKATEVLNIDHLAPPDQDKGVKEGVKPLRLHTTFARNLIHDHLGSEEGDDGVTYIKTADFITVADVLEMTVNRDYVDVEKRFTLHTVWEAQSEPLAIDEGELCGVTAITEGYRKVESVIVE